VIFVEVYSIYYLFVIFLCCVFHKAKGDATFLKVEGYNFVSEAGEKKF